MPAFEYDCLFGLLCISATLCALGCHGDDPVVTLSSGALRGKVSYTHARDRPVYAFQGIPFAASPVGPLRFKPPQPAEPWEGVRNAQEQGAVCPQDLSIMEMLGAAMGESFPRPAMSEDCLFLEVYTPSLAARRPVMVWIHGGGFSIGWGSGVNGTALAAMQDVVLVSINYRLGVLGFLSTGDEVALGNYGHLDQVAALQWVQDNIEHFGGDPNQVTIFGESAGSFSVSLHMVSPLSQGLFARGICQSGAAAFTPTMLSTKMQIAQLKTFVEVFECPTDDNDSMIKCLREKTSEEMIEMPKNASVQPYFAPVVDGEVFPAPAPQLYWDGHFNAPELMAGVMTHEGHMIAPFIAYSAMSENGTYAETLQQLEALFNISVGEDAIKSTLAATEKVYMDLEENKVPGKGLFRAVVDLIGDHMLAVPTYHLVDMFSKHNGNAYFYEMSKPKAETHRPRPEWLDSDHGDDLLFTFGDAFMDNMFRNHTYNEDEKAFSKMMMTYWANFAKYGDPNGAGVPYWPKFSTKNKEYLRLATEPTIETNYKPDKVKLWVDILHDIDKPKVKDEL